MIGSPHLSRSAWPVSSNTAPPPTLKKSPSSQASMTRCWNSVSFASRSFSTILRPLMPPWSLHHFENASAVSNISWFRPKRPWKPGSEKVETWIESAVTPGSVVDGAFWPFAAGLQRTPRSPNAPASRPLFPPAVVSDVWPLFPLPPLSAFVDSSLRPHAATTSTSTLAIASKRRRVTVPPRQASRRSPRGGRSPRDRAVCPHSGANLMPRQIWLVRLPPRTLARKPRAV